MENLIDKSIWGIYTIDNYNYVWVLELDKSSVTISETTKEKMKGQVGLR